MLRYIILVFILNTRFTSLGKAVDPTSQNIENSLNDLANVCENNFLKEQIVKKAISCPANLEPYKEDHLRCLLFYDISKQLCDAVGNNKLEFGREHIEDLNKNTSVDSVCYSASKWNITNLIEYPDYKSKIEKILGSIVSCALLCSDDIVDLAVKFSCKYFSWGFSVLSTKFHQVLNEFPSNITKPTLATFNRADALQNLTVVSSPENNSVRIVPSTNQEHSAYSKQEKSTIQVNMPPTTKPDPQVATNKEHQQTNNEKPVLPGVHLDDSTVERPHIGEEKRPHITGVGKDPNFNVAKVIGDELKAKPGDMDDYQNGELESDDIKDGLGDTQGDDDGEGDPMPDMDTKLTANNDKVIKKLETSIAAMQSDIIANREYVSNTFPETFSPNDDHFFPIFMTSILILVLLYVLYHNKSKVSKVVLGLIIEGRQSGRRRNSRGHAYRRLDTLEQAMSTNSSAPPSKIIY